LLSIACAYCGLDPGAGDNKVIVDWKDILKKNIKWGDTLACYEAKSEDVEILCLKDLYKRDVKDLKFFNYKTNKWEEFKKPLIHNRAIFDEIIIPQQHEYESAVQKEGTLNF
jgi:hypothetical protein